MRTTATQTALDLPCAARTTSKHRLSIPRVQLIALNRISSADASRLARTYVCTYMCAIGRARVVKDFIVMNLIFIQTVPRPRSPSHSLSIFPPLLPLSLAPSLLLLYPRQQHSTNRALRTNADVVCKVLRAEQGWRALQRSAISRLVIRNPIKPGDTGEI